MLQTCTVCFFIKDIKFKIIEYTIVREVLNMWYASKITIMIILLELKMNFFETVWNH